MNLIELARSGQLSAAHVCVVDHPADFLDEAKKTFAVLCGHEFCGVCSFCKKLNASVHPDFLVSFCDSLSTARALVDGLCFRPFQSSVRMVVICGDRSMAFQNILLKSFEEPPPQTLFFYLPSALVHVLPTVLSRCAVLTDVGGSMGHSSSETQLLVEAFLSLIASRDLIKLLSLEVPDLSAFFEGFRKRLFWIGMITPIFPAFFVGYVPMIFYVLAEISSFPTFYFRSQNCLSQEIGDESVPIFAEISAIEAQRLCFCCLWGSGRVSTICDPENS